MIHNPMSDEENTYDVKLWVELWICCITVRSRHVPILILPYFTDKPSPSVSMDDVLPRRRS